MHHFIRSSFERFFRIPFFNLFPFKRFLYPCYFTYIFLCMAVLTFFRSGFREYRLTYVYFSDFSVSLILPVSLIEIPICQFHVFPFTYLSVCFMILVCSPVKYSSTRVLLKIHPYASFNLCSFRDP